MIIILKSGVGDAEIEVVCSRITEMGYHPHIIRGEFKTVVAAVGEERGRPDLRLLEALETVESVMPVQQPFKLASKEVRAEPSEVRVNGVAVGGKAVVVMAGPCSVESESQMREVAEAVKGAGAKILRGGAYKPRTSPYAFQGLKEQGLHYLAEARKRTGLPVRHRGARDGERRAGRRARRHAPDRRAQHAELHAAPARRRDAASPCC